MQLRGGALVADDDACGEQCIKDGLGVGKAHQQEIGVGGVDAADLGEGGQRLGQALALALDDGDPGAGVVECGLGGKILGR